jgi:hypothetical protein
MGSYAEWFRRILTKEVGEIQVVHGVRLVEIDLDLTLVDTNTQESEDGPYDALNLERDIQVQLECHHLLLVS